MTMQEIAMSIAKDNVDQGFLRVLGNSPSEYILTVADLMWATRELGPVHANDLTGAVIEALEELCS